MFELGRGKGGVRVAEGSVGTEDVGAAWVSCRWQARMEGA